MNRTETTRRQFLMETATGVGCIALFDLLARDKQLFGAEAAKSNQGLHHAARAKQVIHIFLGGGPEPHRYV